MDRLGVHLDTARGLRCTAPPDGRPDQVVDGIVFRRPKPALRAAVAGALARGDEDAALRLLLADQDRFAPTPPPTDADLDRLLADDPACGGPGEITLREAMDLLSFGAVGDYFAYRWCSPTWLSGLQLLSQSVHPGDVVVEVACGIGHYLRALELLDVPTVGIDIVFAKLWLARRFLGVTGPLVCADIEVDRVLVAPRPERPRTVFCHDAFYFFEHKDAALHHLRALAGEGGHVAVGHVHTRVDAHEAGFGESLEDYRRRLPAGAALLDDGRVAGRWFGSATDLAVEAGEEPAAVAWLEVPETGPRLDWSRLAHREGFRQNPLLSHDGQVLWPSEGWREEYRGDAEAMGLDYLAEAARAHRAQHVAEKPTAAQRERLFRSRRFVNLPERW